LTEHNDPPAEMGRLRVTIGELPDRKAQVGDETIDLTLRRLGASEGSACRLDCDCRIGLVCVQGICSEKQ